MSDEALKVAEAGITHYPYVAELYLEKATALVELHVYEYAAEVLEEARAYRANHERLTLLHARILGATGDPEGAFAMLATLPDDGHDPVLESRRATAEATILEHQQQFGQMYDALARALRAWSGNAEALELLWICTELTARHVETTALCEDLLAGDVYNVRAWYNLGHARYATGEAEAALAAFEYAYIIDTGYELAYREAGEICIELGQFDRAVDIFETLLEYVRCDNDVLLRLGRCYLHTGALAQARLCITRVLARLPDHEEALHYSGLCYAAEGRWAEATQAHFRAQARNPRSEFYAYALAEACMQTGDYLSAERAYARSCELAPETPQYWLAHAMLLHRGNRDLEALQVLDEADEHTYAPSLRYARVAVVMALGREPEALRQLAETLEEEFDAHEELFALAPELAEHDLVRQVIRCFA